MSTIPPSESEKPISLPDQSAKKSSIPEKDKKTKEAASGKIGGHIVAREPTPGQTRAGAISKTNWTTTQGKIFDIAEKIILPARQNEVTDRKDLRNIRRCAADELKAGISASEISRHLTQGYKNLLSRIFEDGIEHLEQKFSLKTPCKYSVIALGSWSRNETGPFSDFDNFILTEKKTPETERYFMLLNTYAAERLERLGESFEAAQGLSFCWGMLNAPYQAYDMRYRSTEALVQGDPSSPSTKPANASQKDYKGKREIKASV